MTAETRDRSKHVFGNRYMLEVCVRIAESSTERVSLVSLIGDSGLSPSLYSAPLRRLAAGGLLEDLGRDQRTHWYGRRTSGFWAVALDLARSSFGDES